MSDLIERIRPGVLPAPLVIKAIGPTELLLVQEKDSANADADAMMYELDQEALLEEIKPIGIWLKFLYGLAIVDPPIPFTEEERKFRVENYQARIRARAAVRGKK